MDVDEFFTVYFFVNIWQTIQFLRLGDAVKTRCSPAVMEKFLFSVVFVGDPFYWFLFIEV